MSETWFKVRKYDTLIDPVEVVKKTEKFVTLRVESFRLSGPKQFREDRRAKVGEYERYFPAWEEAHSHLLFRAEMRRTAAISELEDAERELALVEGMKPPKSPVA